MAFDGIIDTGRSYGIEAPGFAVDWRPGINPSDWTFNDTYAWPVPHGPQPISLLPAVLKPEWETTKADTGPYARYRLDHFNYPAGKVHEYARLHEKDWVLRTTADTSNGPDGFDITSKWNVEQNEGISFNFAASGKQLSNSFICRIQFGHTDTNKRFNLNIYENGHAFLGRGAGLLAQDQLADGYIVPRHDGSILGRWIKLFIYFYGRNRLLIASSTGNSFIWEDTSISREPETAAAIGTYRISEQSLSGGQPQAYSVYHADTGFTLESANSPLLNQLPPPVNRLLYPANRAAPIIITTPKAMHIQARRLPFSGGNLTSGYVDGTIIAKLPTLTNAYSNAKSGGPPLTGELPSLRHTPSFDPGWGKSLTGADPNSFIGPDITSSPNSPFRLKPNPLVEKNKRISLTPTIRLSRPAQKDGDENKSPTFYRHETSYTPLPAIRPNLGNSIKGDIVRFTHHHDKEGTTGSLELRNAQNHNEYKRAFNIPFQWTEGDSVLVQGYLSDPEFDRSKMFDQRITMALTDEMKLLKTQYLGDMKRLDGLAVDDAVKEILIGLGFPEDGSMWVIDPIGVITDRHGKVKSKVTKISKGEADDEPTQLSDVLKTGEDWLKYLIDAYTSCANYPYQWVMGWAPYYDTLTNSFKYKFFFRNPDILNTLPPTKTFYETRQQAIDAGANYELANRRIYTDLHSQAIEPEFNALLVVGIAQNFDPDGGSSEKPKTTDLPDGKLIKIYQEDKNSIKADVPLKDRKSNYLGWRQLCIIYDGALNTVALATAGCSKVFKRGSQARERATLKAEWEPTVRVWDEAFTYQLKDGIYIPQNNSDYELIKWNITGFDIEHILDTDAGDSPHRQRPATYYLERGLPV